MRGGVDAARQAGDDHVAFAADVARQLPGEFAGNGGGVARADHGNAAAREEAGIAPDPDQRRRTVGFLQQRRIVRFATGDEARANGIRIGDVAFGLFASIKARRPAKAAFLRQFG